MGRAALPRRARDTRRGAGDRLALRRARPGGHRPRLRRARRPGSPRLLERGPRPRSTAFPVACTCCSRRAAGRDRATRRTTSACPPELAADLVLELGPLRAAPRGPPGRHALDRARRGRGRSRAPFARCRSSPRRSAGSTPARVATASAARGRVPARADARPRPQRRVDRRDARDDLRAHRRASSGRDAPRSSCARAARLVPSASRQADGSYDSAAWERMRAEPPPAARRGGGPVRASPVVARDADSPLIPTLVGASASASPRRSRCRSARGPDAIGALVLDDPAPNRFPRGGGASSPRRPPAHVAATIEQALESDERTSHLRAARAIRRLLEEGAGAVSVQEAGEVLARVTRDALERRARDAACSRTRTSAIEHVISVGADGDFERVLRERIESMPASELRHLAPRRRASRSRSSSRTRARAG